MGAALFSGSAGPIAQVSRLLDSAASLGEAAAETGTKVLTATSEMASSLSGLAATAAHNSLALSATAWRGIDVLEIIGSRCDGTFAVDAPELVAPWLSAPHARRLAPCLDDHLVAFASAAAEAISPGFPVLDQSAQDLNVLGFYGEFHAQASLAATGHILVKYSAINLSFTVRWANPLWDTLDFPVSQERPQILEQLSSAKQMLPVRLIHWNAEYCHCLPCSYHSSPRCSVETLDSRMDPVLWSAFSASWTSHVARMGGYCNLWSDMLDNLLCFRSSSSRFSVSSLARPDGLKQREQHRQ
jgi:hypothetical protein